MVEAKTRPHSESVTAYLAAIKDPIRRKDCRAVSAMMRKASGARAERWGRVIVGFGRVLQTYANGKTAEWPAIAFAPGTRELTLYLHADFPQRTQLLAKLGPHRAAKSCLYLRTLESIDREVLGALIAGSLSVAKHRLK
jgi:Domain of unknown function (DU1801)